MTTFSKNAAKAERRAICDAFDAITYLSGSTNWSDPNAWSDALKLERRELGDALEAKAYAVLQWYRGASTPECSVSSVYYMRPGAMKAFMLGVRHAVERADSPYTGPLFQKALEAAALAIDVTTAINNREEY